MLKFSKLIFIFLTLTSYDLFCQPSHSDVIFLAGNFSSYIVKLKTGDLIRVRPSKGDSLHSVAITGISLDTIFSEDGYFLVNQVKEIRTPLGDRYLSYYPSLNQVIIPPDEVYISPERMGAFENWACKETKIKGRCNPEEFRYVKGRELRHRIFLEDLRKFNLYYIEEGRRIIFTAQDPTQKFTRKIERIKRDTVCFDTACMPFRQFSTIELSPELPGMAFNPFIYARKDSLSWLIHFPPDEVYQGPLSYKKYLADLHRDSKARKTHARTSIDHDNYLKFNLAKLVHVEFAFAYEHKFTRRFSWETEAGYLLGFQNADAHYQISYPLYNYNGLTFLTYPKFYSKNLRFYISPVLHYRYLWFNQVRTGYPGGSDNLQDQIRDDAGLSLRFGIMRTVKNSVIDWYVGLGGKYVYVHQSDYGRYLYHDSGEMHWFNQDHSPVIKDYNLFQVIFNLGIKIGFGFQ